MVETKSAAESARKWAARSAGATADYVSGSQGKGASWQSGASAAAGTYRAAVSAGDIEAKFRAGIGRAGAGGYEAGVREKGQARYGQGVQQAAPKFSSRIEPVLSAISGVTLPARQPRGSPANLQRVSAITQRLAQLRSVSGTAGR